MLPPHLYQFTLTYSEMMKMTVWFGLALVLLFELVGDSSSLLLADAEDSSELLGSQQSDDGVRAHTEVVRRQTSPEASDAFLGEGLGEAVRHARVGHLAVGAGLLLLHLRLDVVEGQGADGSSHSCDHRAAELNLEGRGIGAGSLRGHLLGSVVGDEHAHVEGTSSHHGGHGASPEGGDTLLGDDTREGIHDVLVVAALSLGQRGVSLHPDESQIARVAHEGTEGASSQRGASALQGRQALSVVLVDSDPFREVEVDAETESSVDSLTQKGRVESSVEFFDTSDLEDLLGDADGGSGTTGLGAQLDAHLDHVNGLNASGGRHR